MYLNGTKIKKLLKDNNLTQNDLASLINTDAGSLSDMLNYKSSIPDAKISCICELFRLTPKDILMDEDFLPPIIWNHKYFEQQLLKNNTTTVKLSNIVGIHYSCFSAYKRKKSKPSYKTGLSICKALNCSPAALLNVPLKLLEKGATCDKAIADSSVSLSVFEAIPDKISENTAPEYRRFTDQNVINNMEIINENILLMGKRFEETVAGLTSQIEELKASNKILMEKLSEKNNTEDFPKNTEEKQPSTTSSIGTVSVQWQNNHCSDKEMEVIINTDLSQNIPRDDYKKMIYKLTSYISKKQNLIFNQILHNNYNQFSKVYGQDINTLKKVTRNSSALDAIYDSPGLREIFFNMMCTNASHAKETVQ